jgi:hypothetical protein
MGLVDAVLDLGEAEGAAGGERLAAGEGEPGATGQGRDRSTSRRPKRALMTSPMVGFALALLPAFSEAS